VRQGIPWFTRDRLSSKTIAVVSIVHIWKPQARDGVAACGLEDPPVLVPASSVKLLAPENLCPECLAASAAGPEPQQTSLTQ
jgi:hypothetical protein